MMTQLNRILCFVMLTGTTLLLEPTHVRAQVPVLPPPPPPSPCDRFALVPGWVGHFTINGTGSGTFGDGSTYSIDESVTAAPQLRYGSSPSWAGSFNETIHIDDLLSHPDGTVSDHFTDDEKLLQGPITGKLKPPPGLPRYPGAGLSVDLRACTFQFTFDPSFGPNIGQYGFIGLQPSGSLVVSMGNIQGPLPTTGLVIAGSASVSGFSALVGGPGTWTVSWSLEPVKFIVVIDPGHGQIQANDNKFYYQRPPTHACSLDLPAALARGDLCYEDNFTLAMANVAANQLGTKYPVYLTRTGSAAPFAPKGCGGFGPGGFPDDKNCEADLVARELRAAKWGASALVSIHTDGNANPQDHGTTSYYRFTAFHATSLCNGLLSNVVAVSLHNALGCRQADFTILVNHKFPSSLIEVAFHSNWQLAPGQLVTDEAALNDPVFRANAGHAIANAIDDFITKVLAGGQ